MADFSFATSYVALWMFVIFQGLIAVALLHHLEDLRSRAELGSPSSKNRLPAGIRAPKFTGTDLRSGKKISYDTFHDRGVVILFVGPDCSRCRKLAEDMRSLSAHEVTRLLLVCNGTEQACQNFLADIEVEVPLVVGGKEIIDNYRVSGFPLAVVIDKQSRIAAYLYPRAIDDIRRYLADPTGNKLSLELV